MFQDYFQRDQVDKNKESDFRVGAIFIYSFVSLMVGLMAIQTEDQKVEIKKIAKQQVLKLNEVKETIDTSNTEMKVSTLINDFFTDTGMDVTWSFDENGLKSSVSSNGEKWWGTISTSAGIDFDVKCDIYQNAKITDEIMGVCFPEMK